MSGIQPSRRRASTGSRTASTPGHGHGAGVRAQQGGQDQQERGLARAVRADEGRHGAGGHGEGDVPHRMDGAERAGEAVGHDPVVGGHPQDG
ncbi:hypothetical protein GY12_15655 [Micrococcus luteus]|nr:hypothetical protein GY12_15655 [Micrococcus luteus]